MMIRGVTVIWDRPTSRPMPRFLNSRLTPGTLSKIGTPRVTLPSLARLIPPNRAVPPSGTLTVVCTVVTLNVGNWTVISCCAPPERQQMPQRRPRQCQNEATWLFSASSYHPFSCQSSSCQKRTGRKTRQQENQNTGRIPSSCSTFNVSDFRGNFNGFLPQGEFPEPLGCTRLQRSGGHGVFALSSICWDRAGPTSPRADDCQPR